jgi:alpha-ribazole phosphatase
VPLAEPTAPLFERLDAGLPALDGIVTSPLQRCALLAQWLSQRRGVPLETDPRWQELDFGQWEGRRWDDIGRSQRAALDRWALDPLGFVAPGGESVQALHARVNAALADVQQRAAQRGWRRVVIVSHGGPIRALLAQAMGMGPSKINALDVPFGGVFSLRAHGPAWRRVTLEAVRTAADTQAADTQAADAHAEDACGP